MGTFTALLALCEGNPPVTGGFSLQRPVTRSFEGFFDLRLIKRLSNQSRRWWSVTPSRSLWRHCHDTYEIETWRAIVKDVTFYLLFNETNVKLGYSPSDSTTEMRYCSDIHGDWMTWRVITRNYTAWIQIAHHHYRITGTWISFENDSFMTPHTLTLQYNCRQFACISKCISSLLHFFPNSLKSTLV